MTAITIEDGHVYDPEGNYLCEETEYITMRTGAAPENQRQHHEIESGTAEILIKRMTEFVLPESKKQIADALWNLFYTGIHQTMGNVSTASQRKRLEDMLHAAIFTALDDPDVAEVMTLSDYIQLHSLGEELISRAVTYEGDRLRDSTILVGNVDPALVDSLKYTPEPQKTGMLGGVLKKKR